MVLAWFQEDLGTDLFKRMGGGLNCCRPTVWLDRIVVNLLAWSARGPGFKSGSGHVIFLPCDSNITAETALSNDFFSYVGSKNHRLWLSGSREYKQCFKNRNKTNEPRKEARKIFFCICKNKDVDR